MSSELQFLSVEQVLAIHERVIAEYGGSLGLRDQGLLESAVAMPKAQFGGEFLHDGIAEMAAAYLFHLCKNHPFVDGNKRVALASALTFLLLNQHTLASSKPAAEQLTLGVADITICKEAATAFFQKHVRREASAKPPRGKRPPRPRKSHD